MFARVIEVIKTQKRKKLEKLDEESEDDQSDPKKARRAFFPVGRLFWEWDREQKEKAERDRLQLENIELEKKKNSENAAGDEGIMIQEAKLSRMKQVKEITAARLIDMKAKAKYLICVSKADRTVLDSQEDMAGYNPELTPKQKRAKGLIDKVRADQREPSPFYTANDQLRSWTNGIM